MTSFAGMVGSSSMIRKRPKKVTRKIRSLPAKKKATEHYPGGNLIRADVVGAKMRK